MIYGKTAFGLATDLSDIGYKSVQSESAFFDQYLIPQRDSTHHPQAIDERACKASLSTAEWIRVLHDSYARMSQDMIPEDDKVI